MTVRGNTHCRVSIFLLESLNSLGDGSLQAVGRLSGHPEIC